MDNFGVFCHFGLFTFKKTSSNILYSLHLVLEVLGYVMKKNFRIIQLTEKQSFGKFLYQETWNKSFQLPQGFQRWISTSNWFSDMLTPRQVLLDGDPEEFIYLKDFLDEHHLISKHTDCHAGYEVYPFISRRITVSWFLSSKSLGLWYWARTWVFCRHIIIAGWAVISQVFNGLKYLIVGQLVHKKLSFNSSNFSMVY